MSRSTQILRELTAGVHLTTLGGFSAVKNPDGTLKVSERGEKAVAVRFTDGFNKSFDKYYWVLGEREFEFNKMLSCAGIDRSKFKTFKEIANAAIGKRVWICIGEVHEIDGENETGNVSYRLFDYEPCLNPEKKPTKKGDPESGQIGGEFLSYKQIGIEKPKAVLSKEETSAIIEDMDNAGNLSKKPLPPEKKKVIEESRKMIKEIESKPKAEKPKSDAINWDEWK